MRWALIAALVVFVLAGVAIVILVKGREVELRARVTVENASQADEVARVLAGRIRVLKGIFGAARWRITRAEEKTEARGPLRSRVDQHGDALHSPDGRGGDGRLEVTLVGHRLESLKALLETILRPGRADFHFLANRDEIEATGPDQRQERFLAAVERSSRWSLKKVGRVDLHEESHLLRREPEMSIAAFEEVEFHTEGFFPESVIDLRLLPGDAARFAEVTRRNTGRQLALVIDGIVRAAPQIDDEIRDGRVQLRGIRDRAAARRLSRLLAIGALPCACRVEIERNAAADNETRRRGRSRETVGEE